MRRYALVGERKWAAHLQRPRLSLFPAFSDVDNDYLIQGVTAGWADTYDWYLPDQYIEVTGVLNGYYLLETTVDPDNVLLDVNLSTVSTERPLLPRHDC